MTKGEKNIFHRQNTQKIERVTQTMKKQKTPKKTGKDLSTARERSQSAQAWMLNLTTDQGNETEKGLC